MHTYHYYFQKLGQSGSKFAVGWCVSVLFLLYGVQQLVL